MVIYNALPRKEYARIFMCNTAKEIWKTLLITHQGNSQVKDNKIDLLVQQYEQFVISEDESIDSAFARFNTIITSLKALDEGYSSKNCVRKFLRALHPKWRAKVTAIKECLEGKSLNVTFDETPPPSKTSPLVDDDLDEEEAIRETEKKNLENIVEDETLEIDEIVNIKESRNHPLENVIGNLNQRTLRSQSQNQSNFFCFISIIEPKNVNEALGDESY
ncbi:hypothetical protein Tco_1145591 [Tanacetum coccineum]